MKKIKQGDLIKDNWHGDALATIVTSVEVTYELRFKC